MTHVQASDSASRATGRSHRRAVETVVSEVDRVADDRAGHAVAAAATAAQLGADDRDHLDAGLAQQVLVWCSGRR